MSNWLAYGLIAPSALLFVLAIAVRIRKASRRQKEIERAYKNREFQW